MKLRLSTFVNLSAASDGVAQHRDYVDLLELAELAEILDFKTFWLTEHHTASGGGTPDPFGLLSAIAARTSRLSLGTAARLLGLTEPLSLAESAAQLDALAGGRLHLGLARGFDIRDFSAIYRDIPTPLEFLTAANTVRELLHGSELLPRPLQPSIPLWLAASSPEMMRSAADAGHHVLTNHYFSGTRQNFASNLSRYRTARGQRGRILAHLLVYVAPSDAAAVTHGVDVIDRYLAAHASGTGISAAALIEAGLVAVGSPTTVTETLVWLESLGVDEVAVNPLLGFHPVADARRSLVLLSSLDRARSATTLDEHKELIP